MCRVTIRLDPASSYLEKDLVRAVWSVLGEEDTECGVNVLSEPTTGNWNVGAQPGDGQPFHAVLDDSQHSAEAVRHVVLGFLQQYR